MGSEMHDLALSIETRRSILCGLLMMDPDTANVAKCATRAALGRNPNHPVDTVHRSLHVSNKRLFSQMYVKQTLLALPDQNA